MSLTKTKKSRLTLSFIDEFNASLKTIRCRGRSSGKNFRCKHQNQEQDVTITHLLYVVILNCLSFIASCLDQTFFSFSPKIVSKIELSFSFYYHQNILQKCRQLATYWHDLLFVKTMNQPTHATECCQEFLFSRKYMYKVLACIPYQNKTLFHLNIWKEPIYEIVSMPATIQIHAN